jgi:ABC-type nitrate/sulfonate/bicarbonate transport system substrate-binding protein
MSFGVGAARALGDEKVDGLWANALGCELAIQLGAGCVIIDPRRGDGPIGAGNYSFATLATTESNIERNSERIEAVVRAIGRHNRSYELNLSGQQKSRGNCSPPPKRS